MSHTPAPWTVSNDMGCPMVWAASMRICDLRGWGHLIGVGAMNLPEHEAADIQDANARLISAAPDLLEALKLLPLEVFDKDMDQVDAAEFVDNSAAFFEAMQAARVAIAKAEGRS